MLIAFYIKRPCKEGAPLGGGIELCGSSSCLGGLRCLLSTEGIQTLPIFLLSDGSLIWMWSASFAQWCRVLLSLSIIMKSLSSVFGCFVEMWWFLMVLVVWCLWSETLSFRDQLVSLMYSAVQLLTRHFQWYIILVFCASGIGSFGCISKDLMVLVPLKKTLILYFAMVCLYCSLRPLIYDMTTLAPSINFTVDGFDFLLAFCWGLVHWKNCVG